MTTINRKQPMRPAEIDLLNQVDTNTADIATQISRLTQEIADRTNADDVLQQNISNEVSARTEADTQLQQNISNEVSARTEADTQLQTNISNEVSARTEADTQLQTNIDNVNAKFPVHTDSIGDLQITNAKLAINAVSTDRIIDKNITIAKLEQTIQDQFTFLQSVPAQEFGTSSTFDVPANSNTSININFGSNKKEAPIVLCGLQHASGNLSCIVTGVTKQQFSVTIYNLSSTDTSGVTIDWIAISGR